MLRSLELRLRRLSWGLVKPCSWQRQRCSHYRGRSPLKPSHLWLVVGVAVLYGLVVCWELADRAATVGLEALQDEESSLSLERSCDL